MHYYQFNIGDYRSATVHLSNEEDLAYRRLLDMYYDTEQKIPLDASWVGRRIRVEPSVVLDVLNDMFIKHEDGFFHPRCDEVIKQYKEFAEAGKRGAAKRWAKPPHGEANSPPNPPPMPTINHKLITNNEQLFDSDADASLSADDLPPCPHQEILLLYKKNLPHLLQPRVWEGNRQRLLKTRWVQASQPSNYSPEGYKTKQAGLRWWDSFFAYIANDSSLANGFKNKERTWMPDLEWIVTASNFSKIIDGKYAK